MSIVGPDGKPMKAEAVKEDIPDMDISSEDQVWANEVKEKIIDSHLNTEVTQEKLISLLTVWPEMMQAASALICPILSEQIAMQDRQQLMDHLTREIQHHLQNQKLAGMMKDLKTTSPKLDEGQVNSVLSVLLILMRKLPAPVLMSKVGMEENACPNCNSLNIDETESKNKCEDCKTEWEPVVIEK